MEPGANHDSPVRRETTPKVLKRCGPTAVSIGRPPCSRDQTQPDRGQKESTLEPPCRSDLAASTEYALPTTPPQLSANITTVPTGQLFLFDPQSDALKALQIALENLDPAQSSARLGDLRSQWPDCPLDWEEDLLALLPDLVAEPMEVEPAVARWADFAALPLTEKLGSSRLNRLQSRFFLLVLDRNHLPSRRPRTAEGRSVGWLCWKAGRLADAKKLLTQEIQRHGDAPSTRLCLGNCHFANGDPAAARINYREALLMGGAIDLEELADRELAKFLASSRRELGEWSVIEACVEGVLPPARMTSREEMDQFLLRSSPQSAGAPQPTPQRRFHRCLTISLNRHFTDSPTLLEARLTMRTLHPRLHARHMQLLEERQS